MADDTELQVKIVALGFAPPRVGHSDTSCLSLTAEFSLLQSGRTVWSDLFIVGPTLASSDSTSLTEYCYSVEQWSVSGALSSHLHILAQQLQSGVRVRMPGLPWKPSPAQAARATEPSPPEAVEAAFAPAIWWIRQPPAAFVSEANRISVRGRLEVRTGGVIFFERLPSGEAPYEVRFGEVKAVAYIDNPGRSAMISLVRHDNSLEEFTLIKDDGTLTVDSQSMRAAVEMLTRKVQEATHH